MSKIHVNRDRQNLGQFAPEDIAEGLRNGRFLPTDLAWREGMESWQPLADFPDLPPPSGEASPPLLAPPPVEPAGPAVPEWERREEAGHFAAAIGTIRQVFTNPIVTFRDMRRTGGFVWPLVFSYVVQVVCGLIGLLAALLWVKILPASWMPHLGDDPMASEMTNLLVALPTMLVGGLVFPFVFSAIYYLVLKLLTKQETAFETVFRVYCYTMGSMAVINLVPVPPIMAVQITYLFFVLVIAFAYLTIALREAAGITTMQAVAVVVLPMVFCCFCGAAALGGLAAIAGSLPGLQGLGQ